MKKAMTVLGLGAAAVALSVSNASAMEQQAQTTTGINLRQDPSATSNKVSELQAGSKVTIKETKNGWTKVQTQDGKSGWVSGYYVTEDDKTTNEQVEANSAKDVNNEASKVENKKVEYKTQENVNKNEIKERNSLKNEVKDNASFSENNIKTVKKETKKEVKEYTESVDSNARLKKTSYLNVRIGPSTSNSISSVIYKGEMFKVVGRAENGWYKVVLNDGKTGWASNKYIDLTNEVDNTNIQNFTKKSGKNAKVESNNTTASKEAGNYGRVNNKAGLNVRSGAGSKSSVISTLKNNDIVNIIGEENGWYKIKLSNGQIGYVGSTLVAKASPSEVASGNRNASFEVSDSKPVSNIKESTKEVSSSSYNGSEGEKVVQTAESFLGTPYSWGGTTPSGFDCSGFTQYVYKNAIGVDIPRVSRDQANFGSAVSVKNAQEGDLLYFDTTGGGRTSHVGIYIGGGKFIHASGTATNPDRVKISNLSENWVNCLGARRVF